MNDERVKQLRDQVETAQKTLQALSRELLDAVQATDEEMDYAADSCMEANSDDTPLEALDWNATVAKYILDTREGL